MIKPDTHGRKKPVEKNLNFFNFKPFFTTIINQRGRVVVVVSNEINSNECHPLLHFYVRLFSTQSKSLWFFCSETQHVLYFCFSPITKKNLDQNDDCQIYGQRNEQKKHRVWPFGPVTFDRSIVTKLKSNSGMHEWV